MLQLPPPLPAIDPSRLTLLVIAGPCLSGKTQLTARALDVCDDSDLPFRACSVDDVFTVDGVYTFVREKATLAHQIVQLTAARSMLELVNEHYGRGLVIIEQCVTEPEELVIFRRLARHFRAMFAVAQTVLPLTEVPKMFRCSKCTTTKPRINNNSHGKVFVFSVDGYRNGRPSPYCAHCTWSEMSERHNYRTESTARSIVPLLRSMLNRQQAWSRLPHTFESRLYAKPNDEVMEFVRLLKSDKEYERVLRAKYVLMDEDDEDTVLSDWKQQHGIPEDDTDKTASCWRADAGVEQEA